MDDRPVLDQVNLGVQNMAAAADFYRLLGADVAEPPPPWDAHHRTVTTPGSLDFDLDSDVFAGQWNDGWRPGQRGVVLGFRVERRDTVDSTYSRLAEAGYLGQQPPDDAFWGARYAVVADPEGTSVGIMSAVDVDRRRSPPDPTGG
jgi:uncharacterized glyoxalase superfamily protein PhnB